MSWVLPALVLVVTTALLYMMGRWYLTTRTWWDAMAVDDDAGARAGQRMRAAQWQMFALLGSWQILIGIWMATREHTSYVLIVTGAFLLLLAGIQRQRAA